MEEEGGWSGIVQGNEEVKQDVQRNADVWARTLSDVLF